MMMEVLLEPTSNKLLVEHAEYDESNTYALERFNTLAGNPVKEILFKLNLPDHRSILMDWKVTPTKPGRMTKLNSSPNFIANCFIVDSLKDGHGGQQQDLDDLVDTTQFTNELKEPIKLTFARMHAIMDSKLNIPDDAEILIHPLHDYLTEVDDPLKLHTSYNTLLVHLQATTNILIKKVFNDVHKKHIEVEEAFKNITDKSEDLKL
ncbi:hypothetical protein Tco_0563832 [Tanacetum coccineum]